MARIVWRRLVLLWGTRGALLLTAHEWLIGLFHHDDHAVASQSPHTHSEQPSVLAESGSLDAVLESGNGGDAGGAFPVPLLKSRQRQPAYDYGWEDGWAAIRANERHRRNTALLLLLHPAGREANAQAAG